MNFLPIFTSMTWISIRDQLPLDNQMVLAYVPYNRVPTPGNPSVTVLQPLKILIFNKNFYGSHKERHKHSENDHFWSGNGLSNHFFQEVTHWIPLPSKP